MRDRLFIDTADWITAPGFNLVKPLLERLLGIRRVNALYRSVRRDGMSAAGFCAAALEHLGISMAIESDLQKLPKSEVPLVVLGNHPTGMIEALLLVRVLDSLRPDHWKFLSNRFVTATPEFSKWAIPLDAFGLDPDSRVNARGLAAARRFLKNGGSIGAFPAGRVAPGIGPNGLPLDSVWSPHMIRLARLTGASVLLVSFPLASGTLLRALPQSLPRLRALFLAREALRPRPGLIRVRLTSAPNISEQCHEDATRILHAHCHDIPSPF